MTTAYFQYGLTTNYGSFSATNTLAATNTTLSVSNLISGLTPGTTYHFRLVALNSAGTTLGVDQSFTVTAPPVATTLAAIGGTTPPVQDVTQPGDVVTPTSGNSPSSQTSGYAIDDNPATKYLNFDKLNTGFTVTPSVGDTVLVGLRLTSAEDAPERDPTSFILSGSRDGGSFTEIAHGSIPDFTARAFTVEVGFTNTAAYLHYRLIFPTVRNAAAANSMQIAEVQFRGTVTASAILYGTVNPNGAVTTAYFQYGLTTNYGSFSATNTLPATNTTLSVSNLIGSLAPGTTYHFRLVGSNSEGATLGGDLLFTTPGSPKVTTLAATAVGSTNATLNGTVNPNGAATTAYFQYGLTTNYGNLGTFTGLPATNVAQTVPGLVVNSVITGAAGINWTLASAPSAEWYSIASSSAGIWQVAVVSGGGIYTSTNSGVTWTQSSAPTADWRAVASSADGVRLAASVIGGGIYTSANRGVTWTQSGAPNATWISITSSSDGTRLAAAVGGGGIYTSMNGGVTWTPSAAPAAGWSSIASSSDGTRLAATVNGGGNIYTSTDGGAFWTPSSAPNASWVKIASSSDGTRLAAVVIGERIYTSTNSGVTWTPSSAPSKSWTSIASSGDGRQLAAGINGGGIYCSTNGGVTWTQSDAPNAVWFAMACSGDGTRMTAGGVGGGRIYTSVGAKSSLAPNTTYHYQLVGVNSQGTDLGDDLTFTTVGLPTVATLAASSVAATNASLNGSVNPGNGATTAYFQYGLTTNYGSFSATNSLAATNTTLSVSNLIGSLTQGTTYHFRLVALNSAGTNAGVDLAFTTTAGAPTVIRSVTLWGTNLIFSVTNGAPGGGWTLLTTTNLTPPAIWSTNRSGIFDGLGSVILTNGIIATEPRRFFIIRAP